MQATDYLLNHFKYMHFLINNIKEVQIEGIKQYKSTAVVMLTHHILYVYVPYACICNSWLSLISCIFYIFISDCAINSGKVSFDVRLYSLSAQIEKKIMVW